ncbi:uncharacterized protein LOC121726486 [Aricia agestis]|uniref:uncharacterized protein LOC121726486 n=1 Tax=Aricia agestis TaxID=91739 RepID=UPI001C20C2F4|nr:uncharacterized protein LOC121726486 [Aricia agestis]
MLLLYFILLIGSAVLEPFESPCDISDSECLVRNLQEAASYSASEDGVEPIDPMFLGYIDGELPILDFQFYNSTLTGLQGCEYKNLSISEDLTHLQLQYDCPNISLAGRYKVSTNFFFITSRGDYTMKTGRYLVSVDSELEKVRKRDATHLQLGDFTLKCELLGTLDLALKKTDSTSSGLMNMANQYMKDNYKRVAAATQDSVWTAIIRKQHDIFNQYLIGRPLEDFIKF